MILEITAITITIKALIAIICGSAVIAGGAVGGVAYVGVRATRKIQQEYEILDSQSEKRQRWRENLLDKAAKHTALSTGSLMHDLTRLQPRTTAVFTALENQVEESRQHQEQGQIILRQSEEDEFLIKQLQNELRERTEQLVKTTDEYVELRKVFAATVSKLEETLQEFDLLKKTLMDVRGERDYAGLAIKTLNGLKSKNATLRQKLEKETQKYERSQQQIEELTLRLHNAKDTILEQQKIITRLESEEVDEKQQNSTYTQRFF